MESLVSPFLSPFHYPRDEKPLSISSSRKRRSKSIFFCYSHISPDPWTLSDGNSGKPYTRPYRRDPRKPLSDDDARRIIKAKARYLSCLRRNQGSGAQTLRWIRRTPEQMARLIEDDRDGHIYGKLVVAAIRTVRALAARPEGSYDMREVMGSFVAKMSFREMCVVLKEQRGWRQARDFFAWMKLQLCYRPSVIVYTILLRVYGQVGKIKLAEQMFLEMLEAGCEPDEVACGTMLCVYARWGRHKDMMLFYSAVRRRDIVPSIAVFNFMLSSLQKQTLHMKVLLLWEQMVGAGVEPNRFTYTLVISSYAKQDLLADALTVFKKMKSSGFIPEEATYGHLISLTIKQRKGDGALELYKDMKTSGIIPSSYSYASLLAFHYKNADYSKALSLLSEMERNKIAFDEVIYGILLRIYGKLGLYEDAQKIFEDIEKLGLLSNEKTYISMAQLHMSSGNYEKAIQLIEFMRSKNVKLSNIALSTLLRCYAAKEDVDSAEVAFQMISKIGIPDAICYNDLLTLYSKLGLLDKAKTLILHIRKDDIKFNEDLYRNVVKIYCKAGMIDDAEELLEKMENDGLNLDKTSKASLMAMYGEAGGLQKAEDLFNNLKQPDTMALSVMLCLYLEYGDFEKSKALLRSLFGSDSGLSAANHLISKYSREGKVVEAETLYRQFFELNFRPEETAFASMITLYGRCLKLEKAKEVFASALCSSKLTGASYNSMIDAYCRSGEINEAYLLHRELVNLGYGQDAVANSILVKALANHGKYHEAECIIKNCFQAGVELDTIAYNTYIKSMVDAGNLHTAVSIYNQMISSGTTPSLQTYDTMISVYGRGGKLEKAIEMFSTAKGLGLKIDEKAYTNMINYYGKAGMAKEAYLLFNEMKEHGIKPGKISYDTMMNAYATTGLCNEAENVFQDMQKDGHDPDSLTYLALVRAYTKGKEYLKAEETINRMLKERIRPSTHFNHIILAFIKEGNIKDAERLHGKMKEIGQCPDLAFCRTMMRGYVDYGLVVKGLSFFETVRGFLKPDGFFLSAAVHLYELAGRESEAAEVLDVINLHGLVFLRNLKVGSKVKQLKT